MSRLHCFIYILCLSDLDRWNNVVKVSPVASESLVNEGIEGVEYPFSQRQRVCTSIPIISANIFLVK